MVKRAGFTLVELIFAIVIISTVVITLPMMSQLLTKNMDSNLVQEAIFAAATELHEATTKHWDENSIDNGSSSSLAGVINIDGSCETNNTSPRYRLRPGHILQPYHRKCLNNLTQIELDTNTNDDIDAVEDSKVTDAAIFEYDTTSQSGYKDSYTSSLDVIYDPQINSVVNPNLKKITVTIKDSDGNTITSLTSYIANIGEVDYYKRSY